MFTEAVVNILAIAGVILAGIGPVLAVVTTLFRFCEREAAAGNACTAAALFRGANALVM
jgi:hypothetical protein